MNHARPSSIDAIDSSGREHALCSPSSADRWVHCTGSVAMCAHEPERDSSYASDGRTAHDMAAKWLSGQPFGPSGDDSIDDVVSRYVDFVLKLKAEYRDSGAQVEMLIEQKLLLFEITGERGARGTADCIMIVRYPSPQAAILHVIDLKAGYGVEVDDDTLQMPVYALAALSVYGLMDDFGQVRTTVVQPSRNPTPITVHRTMDDMAAIAKLVKAKAQEALQILVDGPATATAHLNVTQKGCRFCLVQHKCPAKAKYVHDAVYGEMQDLTKPGIVPQAEDTHVGGAADFERLLPLFMDRVPEIEAWCTYVRARVEGLLTSGKPVQGYKLVTGRAGPRKWSNEDAVVKVCFGNNLSKELIYTLPEVRSPTDLEKRLKKAYPNVWESLQGLITRAPGKPSVAKADDPRPEYAPVFDGESYDAGDLV